MKRTITIFDNIRSNVTTNNVICNNLEEFCGLFKELSLVPFDNKGDNSLISPAVYKPDSTRANDNVIKWDGWVAIDCDKPIFNNPDNILEELKAICGKWQFICYSTASSTREHPKFRLIFPMTDTLPRENITKFWLSLQVALHEIADSQTKDLSRMFYTPGTFKDKFNFYYQHSEGGIMSYGEVISEYYKHVIDTGRMDMYNRDIRKLYIKYVDSSLSKNYNWSSYHDCKFVTDKAVREYASITGTGWYFKMFSIMNMIASKAVRSGYDISTEEVVRLGKEIDMSSGGNYCKKYNNKVMTTAAENAITFIKKSSLRRG